MHEALSQRLARQFRQKIETGEWAVGKRLPTTRALAAELRVSINTVQNAFRHLEAHDLVERRPRLGGYVKAKPRGGGGIGSTAGSGNGAPAALAAGTRKSTVLGVVNRYTENPDADDFCHNITRGAARAAGEAGFHLAMYNWNGDDTDPIKTLLATIDNTAARAAGSLGGVLVFPSDPIRGLLEELDRRQIAWVTINRRDANETQNFVSFDAFGGSRLIGRLFAKQNIDRAVVLSDTFGPGKTSAEKYFGFLQGYVEGGMLSRNLDYIDCDSYQEMAGYERIRRYFDEFGPPKGVYASGDFLALGAARLARERGLRIPEDIVVVGSTGLHVAAYATPPMTVMQVPMEQMGREAARMLMQMSREGDRRIAGRFVPTSLLVRESFVVDETEIQHIRAEITS
jgi:LacI family transcriptional regulator, galactose operon repressor